ncbi:hypothetical protein CLAFUW4_13756 [Fulvia fulva]|uniref:Uncharacterized protein n=1 Tax=Passalora fulva TaxID=5499 RepID=A0A9Q8UVU3_PASFU|nr:uncharacterized protein CLAFUR5_13603 [Fulvia fulva]KAK4610456.1 hypothetical protein CLAFUR4_13759 [Fulvia fulva]KAK4610793.1 hypothetical protein CLAFUR0_13763 [Fulvia fulva]UJO24323.1 hypothetical protein CLAFUR5_13603 [Fulvia fulva]WPV22135.1 hypothetical protein CLAFUW4_13756 [Fulvia fulva]WPV37264.1 hypothetical protein CLAFUW7_13764 [Fulvia fulva]
MSSYGQSSKAGNKSKRHGNDQELDYAEDDQGSGSHRKGWKGTLNSFFSEPAGFYHTEPQTSQYQKQQPEVLRKQAPPAQPERRGTDQGIHKMPVERDAWGRVSEKDKELQRRAEFIEGLKGHITQLMTKQHALEHELRQLQVASFKNIANAQYTPMDDVAIKLELGGIQRSITNIGKLYGADPGDMRDLHTRPLTERDQLHLDLCNVVYLQDAGRQELEEELVGQESAARVFLTGLLSFAVHNEIVSNPFFFLADDVNVKERPFLDAATVDWPQAFFKAYSREWLSNAHEANMWRSQTIRYLFPPGEESKDNPSPLQQFVVNKRLSAGVRAANRFLNGSSKLLMRRGLDQEESRQLCANVSVVFDHATSLAIRLWRQRVALRCHFLHDLANTKFAVDSPELEAHGLHDLDDPADRRLDGKPIRTVVHPSVVAHGTHEGDSYDSARRVWAKALVVLDV